MATITWAEAVKRSHETYERIKAEIEAGLLAEGERSRLDFQTSIACGHRDAERDYITVAEFDFQLCDECRLMIIEVLQTDGRHKETEARNQTVEKGVTR